MTVFTEAWMSAAAWHVVFRKPVNADWHVLATYR